MKKLTGLSCFELQDILYHTIGQDPYVEIGALDECEEEENKKFEICIYVDYLGQAEALRDIIPNFYVWRDEKIFINIISEGRVLDESHLIRRRQKSVANLFCSALRNNKYFIGVKLLEKSFIPIRSSIEVYIESQIVPIKYNKKCYAEQNVSTLFAEVLRHQFGRLIGTKVVYMNDALRKEQKHELYCKGEGEI